MLERIYTKEKKINRSHALKKGSAMVARIHHIHPTIHNTHITEFLTLETRAHRFSSFLPSQL